MNDDRVTVVVDWSPQVLAQGNKAFRGTVSKRPFYMLIGSVAVIVFLGISFGDDLIRAVRGTEALDLRSYRQGKADGSISVFVCLILVFLAIPLINRMVAKGFYGDTPYFSRPWTIQLSVHGIQTKGPYSEGRIDWPAVLAVVPTKNALIISLGGGGFLPLPHEGFPEDVTPRQLIDRIEVWRGAEDF